jgi:hypothetical protein
MTHVLNVQVKGVWEVMWRFEHGECLASKVRADTLALMEREHETHICEVCFGQSEGAHTEPSVEKIAGFLEEAPNCAISK